MFIEIKEIFTQGNSVTYVVLIGFGQKNRAL